MSAQPNPYRRVIHQQRGTVQVILLVVILAIAVILAINQFFPLKDLLFKKTLQNSSPEEVLAVQSGEITEAEFFADEILVKVKRSARNKIKENAEDTGADSLNQKNRKHKVKSMRKLVGEGKKSKKDAELSGWYKISLNKARKQLKAKVNKNTQEPTSADAEAKEIFSIINEYKTDPNIEAVEPSYIIRSVQELGIEVTAPQTLTATPLSSSSIVLTWGAAQGEFQVGTYNLYMNGRRIVQGNVLHYTVKGLTPGTEYRFYVQGQDTTGAVGPVSNTVTVTTLNQDPPAAPGNCVRKQPGLGLEPNQFIVQPGGRVDIKATVHSNDSPTCTKTHYVVSPVVPKGWGSSTTPLVSLDPGQTSSVVTLSIFPPAATSTRSYTFDVWALQAVTGDFNTWNTVTVNLQGSATPTASATPRPSSSSSPNSSSPPNPANGVPNDPFYSSQNSWGQIYDDMWGMKKINAEGAWKINSSSSVAIADIDTGVNRNHPDLKNNMWVNTKETPGNSVDDDGNGYVDDYHGWNFVAGNNNPDDDNGHGTHTAGTIAAEGNNGIGVVGVNWNAKVMAIKFLDSTGCGSIINAAEAIRYAADNGAQVASNSWGCRCPKSSLIEDAIRYAHDDKGMTLVFAAGNDNADTLNSSPANNERVITVGASKQDDLKASFSNWGEKLDVMAPGVDIVSTLGGYCTGGPSIGNGFCRLQGTSMATPHVAGLAALLLAKKPSLSNEDIRQLIRRGSDDVSVAGRDAETGYGRINVTKTVELANEPIPASAFIASPYGSRLAQKEIRGTADGAKFANYKLEGGIGRYPNTWFMLKESSTPVSNGVLGTIDPSQIVEGKTYTIKLTVTDTDGKKYHFQVYDIYVDFLDAQISSPRQTVTNGTLNITGNAVAKNGLTFGTYKIEWGVGSNPVTWSSEGITLLNSGGTQVTNNTLGTWDTTKLPANQTYTLRLTVTDANNNTTQEAKSTLQPPAAPTATPTPTTTPTPSPTARPSASPTASVEPTPLPTAMPMPDPPPTGGTINKKILTLIYNPIFRNQGNKKMTEYFHWNNPDDLNNTLIKDFKESSGGVLNYTIVERVELDDYPAFKSGFKYDEAGYLKCWNQRSTCNTEVTDYLKIIAAVDACGKLNRGEIDELWVWSGPFFGTWESNLAGTNSFWYNSVPTIGSSCQKPLPIMGFNFERGEAEALESYGHRAESTMVKVYGGWANNLNTAWNRFTLQEAYSPLQNWAGCGNAHNGMNATKGNDYERENPRSVVSYCNSFQTSYPYLQPPYQSMSCTNWGCNAAGYLKWWYAHMPNKEGISFDGKYNNWWIYIANPEIAASSTKAGNQAPKVTMNTGWENKTLSGMVYNMHITTITDDQGVYNFEYRLDGQRVSMLPNYGPIKYYTFSTNLDTRPLSNGQHVIEIFASDPLDTAVYGSLRFNVDNSNGSPPDLGPPFIKITAPNGGENLKVGDKVRITWQTNISSNCSLYWGEADSIGTQAYLINSIPNASIGQYDWIVEAPTTNPGDVFQEKVRLVCLNTPFDESDAPFTVTVPIPQDTTPPTTSITAPTANQALNGVVTLQANATDNEGVTMVDFVVNGQVVGRDSTPPYSAPFDTKILTPNWNHSVRAFAYDRMGNLGVSTPIAFTVSDQMGPVLSIIDPANGSAVKDIVDVNIQASDASGIQAIKVTIDDQPVATLTATPYRHRWDTKGLTQGSSHTIEVSATDSLGNSSKTKHTVMIADTTPPSGGITTPSTGQTVRGKVELIVNATDNIGVTMVDFVIDGIVVGRDSTTPFSYTWDSSSGSQVVRTQQYHTVGINLYDKAGNKTAPDPVFVTVEDIAPPTVTFTAPRNRSVVQDTVELKVNVSDENDITAVKFFANDVEIGTGRKSLLSNNYAYTWDTSRLNPGSNHVIKAKALDKSGNAGESELSIIVKDLQAPQVRLTAPSTNAPLQGIITLHADASDNAGVTMVDFLVNGIVVGRDSTAPYSYDWNVSILDSTKQQTFSAIAYDASSNKTTSAAVTATISTPPLPKLTITTPLEGATINEPTKVTIDTDTINQVQIIVNGIVKNTLKSAPYAYTLIPAEFPNGSYQITARIIDTKGKVITSDSVGIKIANVDSQLPTAPTALSIEAPAYDQVTLYWDRSQDNDAVADYWIIRNGVTIARTTETYFTDTQTTPQTDYTYQILAMDQSGNFSEVLTTNRITTPSIEDVHVPQIPLNVQASAVSPSQINISWSLAADNISITGYEVYRNNTLIATVPNTSFGDTNLKPDTTYNYTVKSIDTQTNRSDFSIPVSTHTHANTKAGRISGLVVDEHNKPISGARIFIHIDGKRRFYTTNKDGRYSIIDIAPGMYSVSIKSTNHHSLQEQIQVKGAQQSQPKHYMKGSSK